MRKLFIQRMLVTGLCFTFGAYLLAFFSPEALALKKDSDEPIRINARSIEVNEKTGASVYQGNVVLEQGGLSIHADRIEVRTRHNQPDLLLATGKPVKLRQRVDEQTEELQVEADKVEYRMADRKLDMTGHVILRRGGDVFTGATLHYDLDGKNLRASGGSEADGRISAVIQPKKSSTDKTVKP